MYMYVHTHLCCVHMIVESNTCTDTYVHLCAYIHILCVHIVVATSAQHTS